MDDQRDYAEETHNRNLCPGCESSPCSDADFCADLGPADLCALGGHDLAADGWRMCACGRSLPDHADTAPDPAGGQGCGMTWRLCSRCDFIDEHHITEHDDDQHDDQHDLDQPGGYLRQDVSAGPALPNHHEATEETTIVEPSTAGGDRR